MNSNPHKYSHIQMQLPTYQHLAKFKLANREKRRSIFQINREKLSIDWKVKGQYHSNHYTLIPNNKQHFKNAVRSNSPHDQLLDLISHSKSNSLLLNNTKTQKFRMRAPHKTRSKTVGKETPDRINKVKFIQFQFQKAKQQIVENQKSPNLRHRSCSMMAPDVNSVRLPSRKHLTKEQKQILKNRIKAQNDTGDSRVRYNEIPVNQFLYEQQSKHYSRSISRRAEGWLRGLRCRSEACVI